MISVRLIKTLLFYIILFHVSALIAQPDSQVIKYTTQVISNDIKTMRIAIDGNELSYPVMELNSDNRIKLEFDLLSDNTKNYSYQIIHCNANWEQSDLFSDEFMNGFNENAIYDYEFSVNTKVKYIHYKVVLPNDDIQLKVSGNYVIRIIEDGDRENTVAMARFSIFELLVNIQAEINRPITAQYANSGQEIRLKVLHDDIEIDDPFSEVKIMIQQNNRPDRIIKGIKPVFVRNNELVYSLPDENIILGGNEFRMFSNKNLHQFGENVNDIQYVDTMYHFQLRLDERRSYKRYFWQEDLNGGFLIFNANNYDHHISADYTYVYFYLPFEQPFLDGSVYVFGEFSRWQALMENELIYNFDSKMYEGVLLMKQGIYNYTYIYKNSYSGELDEKVIEGSHYETENDYIIYVYFNGINEDYDRLIGYKVVNSRY